MYLYDNAVSQFISERDQHEIPNLKSEIGIVGKIINPRIGDSDIDLHREQYIETNIKVN
jgi:hypothetical protein